MHIVNRSFCAVIYQKSCKLPILLKQNILNYSELFIDFEQAFNVVHHHTLPSTTKEIRCIALELFGSYLIMSMVGTRSKIENHSSSPLSIRMSIPQEVIHSDN